MTKKELREKSNEELESLYTIFALHLRNNNM